MTTGILGGGISGLTLHRHLDGPSEVLEKDDEPGGLCRTFWKDGFGYDIGGHILFSKHQHVNDLVNTLLGDNVHHARRNNRILFKGVYVKYPFENDLGSLDAADRYECLIEYLKADFPKPRNLEEWAYYTFGRGIADNYLIPYNRKIWKMDPKDISLEWVERIPKPPMEDVVKSALGIETEGYVHQLNFRYPLEGGFQSLVRAMMGPDSRVQCGVRVERIRRGSNGGWTVDDGRTVRTYDRLVCSFPIHEAIRCFEGVPEEVQTAVASLRHNAMYVVLLAVRDESLLGKTATYIPDPSVLPHRVCYMGQFSPRMVKPGTSSLIAEITMQEGDEIDRMPIPDMMERVISDLHRVGLIDREQIITTDYLRIKYAYPVYNLAYTRNTRVLHDWFTSIGVPLLGRFAEFDYINSDECIHRALALAKHLNSNSLASAGS